jgi:serine/threonine protein kinase
VTNNNNKYLCSVYNLHSCNIDCLLRKGQYKDGIPYNKSILIIKELINSLYYLHTKLKVFHADLKTDNILVRGVTKLNEYAINLYNEENFNKKYTSKKLEYCEKYNKKIDKLKSSDKNKIREKVHSEIYKNVVEKYNNVDIDKYDLNHDNLSISLADFGSFVEEGEFYNMSFGTRYYRSPENILVGKSSYPNDIWALGCTIYEILTGEILFDPIKDKNYNRDFYHLKLINELCGEFSKDFLKKTKEYKKYFDKNYKLKLNKDLKFKNMIEAKLYNKVPNNMIEFIKKMLIIDPLKRSTIEECYKFINNENKI